MATFNIATGTDDGYWYSTTYSNLASVIRLGYFSSNNVNNFIKFNSINIPQGATIDSAYITLIAGGSDSGDLIVRIYGNDADNATAPTTYTEGNNLVLTTEYSDWTTPNFTFNSSYNTSSLVNVVQEIVNRAGWTSGNNMQFIIQNQTGTISKRAYSYNGDPAKAAIFTVTWTEPSGASFTQKVVMF